MMNSGTIVTDNIVLSPMLQTQSCIKLSQYTYMHMYVLDLCGQLRRANVDFTSCVCSFVVVTVQAKCLFTLEISTRMYHILIHT